MKPLTVAYVHALRGERIRLVMADRRVLDGVVSSASSTIIVFDLMNGSREIVRVDHVHSIRRGDTLEPFTPRRNFGNG